MYQGSIHDKISAIPCISLATCSFLFSAFREDPLKEITGHFYLATISHISLNHYLPFRLGSVKKFYSPSCCGIPDMDCSSPECEGCPLILRNPLEFSNIHLMSHSSCDFPALSSGFHHADGHRDRNSSWMGLLLLAHSWDLSVPALHQLLRVTPDPFPSSFTARLPLCFPLFLSR